MSSQEGCEFLHALVRLDLDCVRALLEDDGSLANTALDFKLFRGSPLHYASKRDTAELVILLLRYNAQVDAKDEFGRTPLHRARSREVALLLLDHGAHVNGQGVVSSSTTPLHVALSSKKDEVAKVLIQYNADVNATDEKGGTPLDYAHGRQMVVLLIKHGADLKKRSAVFQGRSPLCKALLDRDRELIGILIRRGADINATWGKERMAAIHDVTLLENNHVVQMMEFLLDRGANVNAKTADGSTPFYYTILRRPRDLEVAQLLIRRGANVNAIDHYGHSLFFSACHHSAIEMAQLLIDHGADITLDGDQALLRAAESDRVHIIQFLIRSGIDVNCRAPSRRTQLYPLSGIRLSYYDKSYRGRYESDYYRDQMQYQKQVDVRRRMGSVTPLLLACHHGSWRAVSMLVRMGANVDATDLNGYTPILWASYIIGHGGMGHSYMSRDVVMIIQHGANVNTAMRDGTTPLMLACLKNHNSLARRLLEAGARVDCTNKMGSTPLLFCLQKPGCRIGCAIELLKRGADIHHASNNGKTTPFLLACGQNGTLDLIYYMIRFSPHDRRPQPLL